MTALSKVDKVTLDLGALSESDTSTDALALSLLEEQKRVVGVGRAKFVSLQRSLTEGVLLHDVDVRAVELLDR